MTSLVIGAAMSVAAVAVLASVEAARAQTLTGLPEVLATKLATELVGVFVVSTIMESALTTLFNWRLYREFFNGRAVKTLVMIGFGYAVVVVFGYDPFQRIIGFAGGSATPGTLSQVLSALVLAGGSAAIYELFKTLGLRPPVESAEAKPQPGHGQAWASVKIVRKQAVGDIKIHFQRLAAPSDEEKAIPALAGVVGERRGFWTRLRSVFLADPMRLPTYGGRTLEAGEAIYWIVATGMRRTDDPGEPYAPFSETIHVGRFAERAIVDFIATI